MTTSPPLDPADWRYLAEGKLHVIVAFEVSRTLTRSRAIGYCTCVVRTLTDFDKPTPAVTTQPIQDDPDASIEAGGGASCFRHHVLRLLKERHPDAAGAGAAAALSLYDAARERTYLERVVGPLLGSHYLDLGWTVPVTRAFLEGVATR